MKRLIKKANLTEEQEKFIQECKDSGKFDDGQMAVIKSGFRVCNLTIEQVKFYANPNFDMYQMTEIREGFDNGLTMEQVKIFADPNFDDSQR